jgi:DNA-binding transcriptional ArsR family regulator
MDEADQIPVDDPPLESQLEPSGGLSQTVLYSILADPRRRNLVHFLKQTNEPKRIGDLAEQLAAWENGKDPGDITSQERKRVYISLYQSHLPTLDKAGVVEYDKDRGTVRLTDDISQHRIYLEVVPGNDIPWNLYYIGLTAAGLTLLGLAWLEVAPFGQVPELAWGLIILVMFGGSAFVKTLLTRRRELGDEGPPPDVER